MSVQQITIRRPDDWHVHLRDGDMLRDVIGYTARDFSRAIVMPNLVPPVTTRADAQRYRQRINDAAGEHPGFEPLMTIYLTDSTDPADLTEGYRSGEIAAAKLYPAGATTNAERGVSAVEKITTVLDAMERVGMPLLVHGEVVDEDCDVFDREARFIDEVLIGLCERHPALPVVLEHITTEQAVQFVRESASNTAATVTPHHLMINRSTMFRGGVRPHLYCLPIAKREHHRLAIRAAATSGDPAFFLGTDSAPHPRNAKESACGCAGIFNAPTALACYAQVFDEENALDKLERFASLNGPLFYGREANDDTITLVKDKPVEDARDPVGSESIEVFYPDSPLEWSVAGGK